MWSVMASILTYSLISGTSSEKERILVLLYQQNNWLVSIWLHYGVAYILQDILQWSSITQWAEIVYLQCAVTWGSRMDRLTRGAISSHADLTCLHECNLMSSPNLLSDRTVKPVAWTQMHTIDVILSPVQYKRVNISDSCCRDVTWGYKSTHVAQIASCRWLKFPSLYNHML